MRLVLLISLVALTAICQQNSAKRALVPPASCSVTVPPAVRFTPPRPYPDHVSERGFWLGTEKLWIELPKSGIWGDGEGPNPAKGAGVGL
jgi:hypothetical protein